MRNIVGDVAALRASSKEIVFGVISVSRLLSPDQYLALVNVSKTLEMFHFSVSDDIILVSDPGIVPIFVFIAELF